MAKIEFNNGKDSTELKVGDFFMHRKTNEIYILCMVRPEEYCLICLNDGQRWQDPKTTIEDIFNPEIGCKDPDFFNIGSPFTIFPE